MRYFDFRALALFAGVALAASNGSGLCQAGGASKPPAFIIEALPEQLARKVESQKDLLHQFGLGDPTHTEKGAINALKIWTTAYPQVRVCFFTGSKELRARIAKIAMEWKGAVPGVPLDFGDLEDPRLCKSGEVNQVRIGFAFAGYWSLVGQDSVKFAGQDEQSMNFQDFDKSPPNDDEFRATVLHEFGHAIGLAHEHQNPLAKCKDEFDWDKIYSWLAGPPNNWSKEVVDHNMGALNEPGLLASAFDRKSIMLYTFPPEFFKQGNQATCYNPPNRSISDGDKAIVSALYPDTPAAKVALQNEIRQAYLGSNKSAGPAEGTKTELVKLVDEYMP